MVITALVLVTRIGVRLYVLRRLSADSDSDKMSWSQHPYKQEFINIRTLNSRTRKQFLDSIVLSHVQIFQGQQATKSCQMLGTSLLGALAPH